MKDKRRNLECNKCGEPIHGFGCPCIALKNLIELPEFRLKVRALILNE